MDSLVGCISRSILIKSFTDVRRRTGDNLTEVLVEIAKRLDNVVAPPSQVSWFRPIVRGTPLTRMSSLASNSFRWETMQWQRNTSSDSTNKGERIFG